ncbi:MAG TPA: endonuclease NucS domain-containing protein [Candidatus Bathyarchaeia archaeon]|nr:endonuclease NucS domain-containing protein [Candidatus Bathyarchaeia archaeon]
MDKNLLLELIYLPIITPTNDIKIAIDLLTNFSKVNDIPFRIIDKLSETESKHLEDEFRLAATRGKFKVVSGGGAALVLSGSKKLNHKHGPILVIRKNGEVVQVFPRGEEGIKGSRISTIDFLKRINENYSPLLFDLDDKSFTELNLRNLIINRPSLLEDGLTYINVEVAIDSAIIDLVFLDASKNHLLLEFKLNADDKTIGQVARYNFETYAKMAKIKHDKIRRGIVTLGITGQIIEACKANRIELFVLTFSNIGYTLK